MEHQDQSLSTRDIAPSTQMEPEREERDRLEHGEGTTEASAPATDEPLSTLFADNEHGDLRARWEEIQTRFVDEPRQAVEDADALVAGVMRRLADGFAEERERLEAVWDRGEDVGTEDLRVTLQRYRAFFQRLLTV